MLLLFKWFMQSVLVCVSVCVHMWEQDSDVRCQSTGAMHKVSHRDLGVTG